jgi:hypothetical protein
VVQRKPAWNAQQLTPAARPPHACSVHSIEPTNKLHTPAPTSTTVQPHCIAPGTPHQPTCHSNLSQTHHTALCVLDSLPRHHHRHLRQCDPTHPSQLPTQPRCCPKQHPLLTRTRVCGPPCTLPATLHPPPHPSNNGPHSSPPITPSDPHHGRSRPLVRSRPNPQPQREGPHTAPSYPHQVHPSSCHHHQAHHPL